MQVQRRDPPDRLDRILDLVREHVPDLRLVLKRDDPGMRALGRLLAPVTPRFQTHFTTVVGRTVYLPRPVQDFPRDGLAMTLAHELVHQLDQRRWGPLFYGSYAVALPVGRTARAHWERRAYAVDLVLMHHDGGEAWMTRRLERLVDLFAGPAYGWMWAGRAAARAFLEPVADQVRAGTLQEQSPYREILEAWRGPG